jgi:STE24 endopeptidase
MLMPSSKLLGMLKLYEDNASTLTPDPLFVKFYYSHPPASERLARMGFSNSRVAV